MLLMSVAILLMYIGRSKYAHASCRTGLLRLLNIFNFPFNGKIFLRNKAWYFLKRFRTVFGFKRFKKLWHIHRRHWTINFIGIRTLLFTNCTLKLFVIVTAMA